MLTDNAASGIVKFSIKGYKNSDISNGIVESNPYRHIARDLYNILRGKSNLIFANSRAKTELFSATLNDLCKSNHVPNEFFPHHGSLSKDDRHTLESRLQKNEFPTTAVCTMTLELGIDIGKVHSVVQVSAPYSVSGLRQRLGRSGRRGEPSILRVYILENAINPDSGIGDLLRLELFQSIAMLRLLLVDKWYESPEFEEQHFSTLFHQVLAIIAQWGGVRADQLWYQLHETGPFGNISPDEFKELLHHMGSIRLIIQLNSGELVLGDVGEKIVSHYTFYAVFNTPDEFRVVNGSEMLGTIPVSSPLVEGQHIIFSGRRWVVLTIDIEKRTIVVSPASGGKPPKFSGAGGFVQQKVRKEMLEIYKRGDYKIISGNSELDFLDETARKLFHEGLNRFSELNLNEKSIICRDKCLYVFPWEGDKVSNAITFMLKLSGIAADCYAGVIEIQNCDFYELISTFGSIIKNDLFSNSYLAERVKGKHVYKYDRFLPNSLLNKSYGSKMFDVAGALKWITDFIS